MIETRRGRAVAVAAALAPIVAITLGLPGSATDPATGLPTPEGPLLCVVCGYSGTADFQIGAYDAGSHELDGRIAYPFLCATALSDATIIQLYDATRIIFAT